MDGPIAERYVQAAIDDDLREKMVFISGPRQVGKTTLALALVGARDTRHPAYMVASHLLKLCHFIEDTEGHRMELRFLRDTDAREVDFVVMRDRKAIFAVEAKAGERDVSPAIRYFKARTPVRRWYQVHLGTKDAVIDGVRVLPFAALCAELGLP